MHKMAEKRKRRFIVPLLMAGCLLSLGLSGTSAASETENENKLVTMPEVNTEEKFANIGYEGASFANTELLCDRLDAEGLDYLILPLDDEEEMVLVDIEVAGETQMMIIDMDSSNEAIYVRVYDLITYGEEDEEDLLRTLTQLNYDLDGPTFYRYSADYTVSMRYDMIVREGCEIGDLFMKMYEESMEALEEASKRLAPFDVNAGDFEEEGEDDQEQAQVEEEVEATTEAPEVAETQVEEETEGGSEEEAADTGAAAPGENTVALDYLGISVEPGSFSKMVMKEGKVALYPVTEDALPTIWISRTEENKDDVLGEITRDSMQGHGDLEVVEDGSKVSLGGKDFRKIVYRYSSKGFAIRETWLVYEGDDYTIYFTLQERPLLEDVVEEGYLEELSGSFALLQNIEYPRHLGKEEALTN